MFVISLVSLKKVNIFVGFVTIWKSQTS